MEERPKAETERYEIFVKFWCGDMSGELYEAFKKSVRESFENILPISQGTAEARLLQMKIIKNGDEK